MLNCVAKDEAAIAGASEEVESAAADHRARRSRSMLTHTLVDHGLITDSSAGRSTGRQRCRRYPLVIYQTCGGPWRFRCRLRKWRTSSLARCDTDHADADLSWKNSIVCQIGWVSDIGGEVTGVGFDIDLHRTVGNHQMRTACNRMAESRQDVRHGEARVCMARVKQRLFKRLPLLPVVFEQLAPFPEERRTPHRSSRPEARRGAARTFARA